MKRRHLAIMIIALVLAMCFTGCATDTSGSGKLFVDKAADIGDGSGLPPGTFTLPNGTRVLPGAVIREGSWLYTAASAKIISGTDAESAMSSGDRAREIGRENLAKYLDSNISAASGSASSTSSGVKTTSSANKTASTSNAILQGMEDAGFMYSKDGTAYLLLRVNVSNVEGLGTPAKDVVETGGKLLNSVLKIFK
ncbi:MAG: hypothetical protein RBS49_05110 [Sphaerochaeta sp.]|jgi:hypothetical protein|nr:hypothetical protein [Sphaerochaeta sp.]